MIKQIMIPLAAFALTATSVSAFSGGGWFSDSDTTNNLTEKQLSALEQAREVREAAQEEMEKILSEAGVGNLEMREWHEAMHERSLENREALRESIENGDFATFSKLVEGTLLATAIDTEADFKKFVEAHELMQSGDSEAAQKKMTELGIESFTGLRGGMMGGSRGGSGWGMGMGMGRY